MESAKKSISELSRLAGVSVRTLHYYDSIGLLTPSGTTSAGYRQYDEADMKRLWQIMFYKELDFTLEQIKRMLEAPGDEINETLRLHRDLLLKKRERLNSIIGSIEKIFKGEFDEDMLNDFDMKEIEEAKRKYGKEAEERWGNSEAYQESMRRTKNYTAGDWARVKAEQAEAYKAFINAMDKGFDSREAQEAVEMWRKVMTDNFYDCSVEICAGLGQMYVSDERFTKNIDKFKEGLAQFMSDSIAYYCKEASK